jgi:DNA-binding NarL/FixJ family response regulator
MQAEAKPTGDPSRPAADPSVLAIAASAAMHRRIAASLARQDLRVSARAEAASEAPRHDPAAVFVFACDVDAPREMTSLRRLCREAPESAVVVITTPATGTGVRRALDAGASGVVFDPELERTLATAVRAVAIGQSVVPRKLRAGVERPVLSHRERQVLDLVRKGLTNAQIADRLFLAESTIKSHLASIFAKFGVHSRKEVAIADEDLEQVSLLALRPGGATEEITA